MGVVEDAVADGVGQGGGGEVVVPLGRRQLARDDSRAVAIAILEDLEQVPSLLVGDGREAPVVDQEDVDAGERKVIAMIITATDARAVEATGVDAL
jgi:hypothetical protein